MNNYNKKYFDFYFKKYNKRIDDYVKNEIINLKSWDKVLDAWCWVFLSLLEFYKINPKLTFYWTDIWDVEKFKPNFVKFKKNKLENLTYKNNTFSLIYCEMVLEHIKEPLKVTKELYRILRPNWKLIIKVPSIWTLFMPWDKNFFWDYTHIRPFSRKSLLRLNKDSGFKEKNIKIIFSIKSNNKFKNLILENIILRIIILPVFYAIKNIKNILTYQYWYNIYIIFLQNKFSAFPLISISKK